MEDFSSWVMSFSQLSAGDRERSRQLIGAYNAAVAEMQTTARLAGRDLNRLFTRREVEQLVLNFRAKNYSKLGPAMKRYLQLLEEGYVWPCL